MPNLAVTNLTKRPVSDWPFENWKNKILGKNYNLSLVFCGPAKTRELNIKYRHKDKVSNILSFPISKTAGEVFIKLPATDFSIPHLFIHGLLHLKGLTHSSKMKLEERKFLTLFKVNTNGESQHNCRARHRNRVGASRRLRT